LFQVGEKLVAIDQTLLRLLAQSCFIDAFATENPRSADLEIIRSSALSSAAIFLEEEHPWLGRLERRGRELLADIPDEPIAAETLLRHVFNLETCAQGGFLMHASGVAVGNEALIATGPSTAGKSTFAELCLGIPGARLLSDEMMAIFPDGSCLGTPFRSTLVREGSTEPAQVRSFFTLVKGHREEIRDASIQRAMSRMLSQVFWTPLAPLTSTEIFRRVSEAVNKSGIRELTFRKHPAVTDFLSDWLKG
jgi:hypothetical protein